MIKKINNSILDKPLNILLTGGSSGIGYQAVLKLISLGHNIILPCRNIVRANQTLIKLFNDISVDSCNRGNISTPIMDLSDLKSIESICNEMIKRKEKLDILILNAGLQYTGSKEIRRSSQGVELTFAVNHLAHHYLTRKLLPLLNKTENTRIIITSSEVHNPSSPGGKVGLKASLGNFSGLEKECCFEMLDGKAFNADKAYKDSKLCNILFAKELSNRLQQKNYTIPVIAWAPGLVISRDKDSFFRYSRKYNELGQLIFASLARDLLGITTTNEKAGSLLCDLVVLAKYQKDCFYFYSNKIVSLRKFTFERTSTSFESNIEGLSEKLWELSEKLVSNLV